jgi:RNA polymerase sigma-70 factor (ECF subfamily)
VLALRRIFRDGFGGHAGKPKVTSPAPEFRSLFEREFSYVWHTLRRLGVGDADRMDVAQEVFVTVSGLMGDYDPERPLRPWLFGIAYRIGLRYKALARHGREVVVEDPSESPDRAPLADEAMAQKQRAALVDKAIERIDLTRRAVFIMSEIDGCAMPEIAEALGISVNTGYSRLRLAREEFEAAVRRLVKRMPA